MELPKLSVIRRTIKVKKHKQCKLAEMAGVCPSMMTRFLKGEAKSVRIHEFLTKELGL